MGIRLGVAVALPLLLVGCGDSRDAASGDVGRTVPDLDGTSWIATDVTEHGQARALVPGSEIRVEFADGSISVTGGCNRLGGTYSLNQDAELRTGTLAGTDMGCSQALLDQDTWLSQTVFASPLVASVDSDRLTLSRAGLEIVLADRAAVAPDAALVDTHWQLDGIRTGDVVASVPSGSTPATLTLAGDGTVTLQTGCNSGGTTATVAGSTITFGPVVTTKKACADRAGRQTEAAVLGVLDGDVAWSISEQTLTLSKGDRALVYRAVGS